MQAASFVTVVAAILHHLSRVGYEIITPITVQQEEGAFSKSSSMGPSPKCLEMSQLEQEDGAFSKRPSIWPSPKCLEVSQLEQEDGAFSKISSMGSSPKCLEMSQLEQEEGASSKRPSIWPSPKCLEMSQLEQEEGAFSKRPSIWPSPKCLEMSQLEQEDGAFSKRPSIGSSPKCLEVSHLEQDFCPVFQTPVFLQSFYSISPRDQCYIHQNGRNSTQSDSMYSALCNALIWIVIHFLWKQYQRFNSRDPTRAEDDILTEGSVCTSVLLLDKGVLQGFYERCIHSAAHENWRVLEFVEGFSVDLLQALRSTLDREADLQVEDCIGVGSMYESWRVSKPLSCDLIIPLAPPKPYCFSFQLWCTSVKGTHPIEQAWGRIQLDRTIENKTTCLCVMAGQGEDLLCLLHRPQTMSKCKILENLLCSKDTPFLGKAQVMKWLQIAITEAWGQISHKYEFELTFRNFPGPLKVRFRSGKTVIFNLTPVIRFEDSDVYFASQFPSNINNSLDTYWPLSFAVYEKHLLKYLAERLPGNACHIRCLQIVSFLHKKQTQLTGRTSLSVYHLKTALLHLLLDKRPLDWSSNHLENRACDILEFVWKSLRKIELRHALIGNGRVPKDIGIPPGFYAAQPINLFHSLALRKHLHTEAVRHFQEMLRNAAVLIREYSQQLPGGN